MKKRILFVILLLMFLSSCVSGENTTKGEIDLGYSSSTFFSGHTTFKVSPIDGKPGEFLFTFNFGHTYSDSDELDTEPHEITIYSTESNSDHRVNNPVSIIYRETIEDFGSDSYRCSKTSNSILVDPVCYNSFELEIISDDIPYESGILQFTLSVGVFDDNSDTELSKVRSFVYFTNYEGELIFYTYNPN